VVVSSPLNAKIIFKSSSYIQRYNQIGKLASAPKTRKDHHATKTGKNPH